MEMVVVEIGIDCPLALLQGLNESWTHGSTLRSVLRLIFRNRRTVFEDRSRNVATVISSLVGALRMGANKWVVRISSKRDDAQSRITQEYGIGRIPNGSSPASSSSGMLGM